MRKTSKFCLPAGLGLLTTLVLGSQLTFAATSHQFVGVNYFVSNEGGQATITTPGDTSVASGGSSSAWVMAEDKSTGAYAQTGWVEAPTINGRYYFFEVSSNGGTDYTIFYSNTTNGGYYDGATSSETAGAVGPALDSTHTYKVWGDSNSLDGVWQGSVDGAFSNNFYGTLPKTTSPNNVEFNEEVNDVSLANFFGSTAVETAFNQLGYTTWDSSGNQVLHNITSIPTTDVINTSIYGSIDTSSLSYGRFWTRDTRNN